ncbi:MAG: c-type cytochrome [Motiliproteus sp.]
MSSNLVIIASAHSDDTERVGEQLYNKYHCVICHGALGGRPVEPTYPRLSGQNKIYLQNQIKDIRDGKRENGLSHLMRPLVKNISDSEAGIIAYFLSIQSVAGK